MTISGVNNVATYIHGLRQDPSVSVVVEDKIKKYNKFYEVINTSGEEISGQLMYLNDHYLFIKTPARPLDKPLYHGISIDNIASIHELGTSFLPKLAFEWKYNQSGNETWLAEVIKKNHGNTALYVSFIGKIVKASQEYFIDGHPIPCSLTILTDPEDSRSLKSFGISDFSSIRLLYNPKIAFEYEKNKCKIITETLLQSIAKELIGLVLDYLSGEPPLGLPQVCYDFLNNASNKKRKFVEGAH